MKNAHPNAPPEEPIKQGVEATLPAEQATLQAQQAEQPASEAPLESNAVVGEVLDIEADELNVRIRINPAVFYLHEAFKARAEEVKEMKKESSKLDEKARRESYESG
jgi:hypothetical protein